MNVKRIAAALGFTAVLAGGIATGVSTLVSAHVTEGGVKVTICHATASQSNPYVKETVDASSIESYDAGHGNSGINVGDIIPPFTDGSFHYAGQGDQSYLPNCVPPVPTTTTVPVTTTTVPPTTVPPTTVPVPPTTVTPPAVTVPPTTAAPPATTTPAPAVVTSPPSTTTPAPVPTTVAPRPVKKAPKPKPINVAKLPVAKAPVAVPKAASFTG